MREPHQLSVRPCAAAHTRLSAKGAALMAVTIIPSTVAACSTFSVIATGAPTGATSAVFTYDGDTPQTLPVVAGAAGPATFTAVGSGVQLISVTYVDASGAVVGSDSGTVTVTAAPAGTISTTLSASAGGTTTATTTLTCSAGLASVNGTLTYTLPDGTTVTASVVDGVVQTVDLGVTLTGGQTVAVSFTPATDTCVACTFAPITVTLPAAPSCLVLLLPPPGTVTAGQPTSLTAVVLCNGLPVSGASVTFSGGGATPVTVTTNALGIATGSVTFPTAGPVSVTATATATGTACACTNVSSTPVTVTVAAQPTCTVVLRPVVGPVIAGQPTTLTAVVLCNGLPVSGASVTFSGGGATPVTVTTNTLGIATGSVTFPTAGPVSVTATVTATNTACACTNVSSAPVTVTVAAQPSCLVFLLPPSGPVIAGQPTSLTAVVLCNGLPVSGASVTFSGGGATPVTVTTNALGIATGSVTFPTAGPVSVTATATAAGTACACTNVSSTPLTITVTTRPTCTVVLRPVVGPVIAGQPTTLTAVVLCNGLPVSGASVTFSGGGATPVTVTTNALGIATGSVTFPTAGPVSVTATVTATNTACACTNVSSAPVTVTVTAQPSCLVFLLPPSGTVIAGQPTSLTAVVLCNGLPVSGASVTFSGGGATPVTVTTNALGIATGSVTFPTAGPVSVTATATATGTACACSGVASTPLSITVTAVGTGVRLQALPSCWQANLQIPLPTTFPATLQARVSPATAGVTVSFFVGGQLVGTAVTDATGTATLNTSLSLLQVLAGTFTATATVGGTAVQATGTLLPCLPSA
ncbi:hypothetical protein ABZ079_08275 [Streptomyces sp. NPDC006314]|uniref:hypothetical protein n=1 Tax=Streptomyces sp. NPDC006314 TaxID=3154475 RepID=UPI0033AC2410